MRCKLFLQALILTFALLTTATSPAAAGGAPDGGELGLLPPPLADPAPPPVDASPSLGSGPSFEEQVLELTNQERWDNGQLPPLKGHVLLAAAAEGHSTAMGQRNFFSHCDLDTGLGLGQRISNQGYSWNAAAENIAAGQGTPQSVMSAWMASTGHRNNILSTTYHELGVGYYLDSADSANVRNDLDSNCTAETFNNGPYFRYWTQDFGRRSSNYPVVIEREAYATASRDVDLYLYGAGWAQEMRLRNELGAWSPWMPFATDVAWQLSLGGGVKTVWAEIRNGATVRSASDTIVLDQPIDLIFTDGFESGDTSAWSNTVP